MIKNLKLLKPYSFLLNKFLINQWVDFLIAKESLIMKLPSYHFEKFPDTTANRLQSYNLMKDNSSFIKETKSIVANISSFFLSKEKKWITCWANILTYQEELGQHSHDEDQDKILSGIIFLSRGSELIFPKQKKIIIPQSGLGILFPSSWKHYVKPQNYFFKRLSIAFDIREKRKTKLWILL